MCIYIFYTFPHLIITPIPFNLCIIETHNWYSYNYVSIGISWSFNTKIVRINYKIGNRGLVFLKIGGLRFGSFEVKYNRNNSLGGKM